jgi:hypothetical protein
MRISISRWTIGKFNLSLNHVFGYVWMCMCLRIIDILVMSQTFAGDDSYVRGDD